MLKERIERDLKDALLGGDKQKATVLRGLKSTILYEEVAKKVRDQGLSEEEIVALLSKEVKKRQESVDIYRQAGESGRAEAELAEKNIIEVYLPQQLSDDELRAVVDEAVRQQVNPSPQVMGTIIGAVKKQIQGTADGSRIAQFVKERLGQ
jgi:uncharacterized protein